MSRFSSEEGYSNVMQDDLVTGEGVIQQLPAPSGPGVGRS
jgi:hypothetical protein